MGGSVPNYGEMGRGAPCLDRSLSCIPSHDFQKGTIWWGWWHQDFKIVMCLTHLRWCHLL